MSQYFIACLSEDLEARNPRLVAIAKTRSRFAKEPQVINISTALFDTADETMVAEHGGVLGAWVTPVLFIPPRALCDSYADALVILECERSGR